MFKPVLFFIGFLIFSTSCKIYDQNISIDYVTLTNEYDTIFSIESPKAIDLNGKNQLVVDKINSEILKHFGIPNFNRNQALEFRWGEVKSTFEIEKEVLYMHISASYYGGNYPNDYEDDLFFDLTTGDRLYYKQVPFKDLFTSSGYSNFLDAYWIPGAKIKLDSAAICAGMEPLCTYYDISDYTVKDTKLSVFLTNSCFARVAQFCSPKYDVSVELSQAQPYLNDTGKIILSAPNNFSVDPIERIRANQKLFNREISKD